jgi:creatinine amidohydrolase
MVRALSVAIVICLAGALLAVTRQNPTSRIHKLDELTWPQIDALDRARTIFILTVGAVEEHGPHLAVGADTFQVLSEVNGISRRVSQAVPDWTVVIMPPIPYGNRGANDIGDRPTHPGTYSIRQSTLRSLIADVGAEVARNGFKWIVVLNGHGGPSHNVAINEACDFVSDTFSVTMIHVTALFRADAAIQAQGKKMNAAHYSAADLESFGMDVHAGVSETSAMLAARPDLVTPNYAALPSQSGRTFEELQEVASRREWQGYLSSPAKATAEYGRAVEAWWVEGSADLILRAVRGENLRTRPRSPEQVPAVVAPTVGKILEDERAFGAKLEDWLARRKKD